MREATIRCAIAACTLAAVWLQPEALTSADWWAYDALSRSLPGVQESHVTVVAIDEASLAKLGRWPWPRDVMGRLVERTLAAGARAVVLDAQFPDADRGAPGLAGGRPGRTNDEALAEALRQGTVVAGYSFDFSQSLPEMRCGLRPLPLAHRAGAGQEGPALFAAPRVLCPTPEVEAPAAGLGFLNAYPDSDGTMRRAPLLLDHDGRTYPSLALSTLLTVRGGGTATLSAGGIGSAELRISGRTIPLDDRGRILIRYRAAGAARVPAKAVMEGEERESLAGRIALIGGTAAGLNSPVRTPADPLTDGVEVQASILENLLADHFWSRPPGGGWGECLGAVAAIELAALAMRRLRPAAGAFAGFAAGAALWVWAAGLLGGLGMYISPMPGIAATGATLGVLGLWHWSRQRTSAEHVRQELDEMRRFTLAALTAMAGARDGDTACHARRLQRYMDLLCRVLADHPRFHAFLRPKMVELLIELTPVHDIGKVGIPDSILLKDGPLTAEEFGIIKQHVDHGRQILESACKQSGLRDGGLFLHACDIVTAHHERWDGSGYPLGLRGEQIPIPARLLAVADVYDALVSKRVYKEAMRHERACETIRAARGSHFDPDVVDAFLARHEEWAAVAAVEREKASGQTAGA